MRKYCFNISNIILRVNVFFNIIYLIEVGFGVYMGMVVLSVIIIKNLIENKFI